MIGWYNGVSPEARRATLPIQRAALRAGLIPKPMGCSICGFRVDDDPSGRNYVGLHDEDYRDVTKAYPVCRACHGHLHRRFERPRPWLRLVEKHGNGTRWFEMLSLDPGCQWRPFAETYRFGLPPR
jgi:hypothetical protein